MGGKTSGTLAFEVLEPRLLLASPVFDLIAPDGVTVSPGDAVTVEWSASGLHSGSHLSLYSDPDGTWNGNENTLVSEEPVSSGAGTYTWDTTGTSDGTYRLIGHLFDPIEGYLVDQIAGAVTVSGAQRFELSGPENVTATAGDVLSIEWTAANVPQGATVSLCYDEDATWWNGNEHWIVIDTPVSEGAGSYTWDTTSVGSGTYYVGGYMYDWNGTVTGSQLTGPVTIEGGQDFALSSPADVTVTVGDVLTIEWTTANIPPGTTVSLCYDEDTTWWNGNEHWIVIDTPVSEGAGTYAWDTSGVAPGTYYVAGYMYDWNGTTVVSQLSAAVTIQAPQTFELSAPAGVTVTVGDGVSIQWTTANVPQGTTISLCYDEDTTWWNGNEHWIIIDTPVSEGAGTYAWDTSGVAPGTYYIAGYMYDWNGTVTVSQLTQPVTIQTDQAFALSAPAGVTATVGDVLTIEWTTANIPPGTTVSLCYDEDTTWWNGNEHWIVIDTPVSEGAGTYAWDTSGVAPGTYYVAGYMYDWDATVVISQLTTAVILSV